MAKKNKTFKFLKLKDIKDKKELIKVDYTGLGFTLVKKGVFESMEYPWFYPMKQEIDNMVDFSMDDVSFCLRAKKLGYKTLVDPTIIVGHEKKLIL